MCDFCGRESENIGNLICPECFMQSRSAIELAKDAVVVLLSRQKSCNVFLLAAAKSLEKSTEPPAEIIYETTQLIIELSYVDQAVTELLEYIDEVEGVPSEPCPYFGCLYAESCPYAEDCDGVDCFFDDPDFFAPKEKLKASE